MFHLSAGLVHSSDKYLRIPWVSAIFIFKSKLMSSPARGPQPNSTQFIQWIGFYVPRLSPASSASCELFFYQINIDWDCKYFWSVCAPNIFYLSAMIEPRPPVWQDGVFYWAQRILDKLSTGSAVTKFRYKLTIEMSPATSQPIRVQHPGHLTSPDQWEEARCRMTKLWLLLGER